MFRLSEEEEIEQTDEPDFDEWDLSQYNEEE